MGHVELIERNGYETREILLFMFLFALLALTSRSQNPIVVLLLTEESNQQNRLGYVIHA